MQSSPQRDVQFFAKKGGLIFRYEKNEYIFVIWALKGMSPVNLKKKFENFLRLHYWVKCQHEGVTLFCCYGKNGITQPIGRQFDNIEDVHKNVGHLRKEMVMQSLEIV